MIFKIIENSMTVRLTNYQRTVYQTKALIIMKKKYQHDLNEGNPSPVELHSTTTLER